MQRTRRRRDDDRDNAERGGKWLRDRTRNRREAKKGVPPRRGAAEAAAKGAEREARKRQRSNGGIKCERAKVSDARKRRREGGGGAEEGWEDNGASDPEAPTTRGSPRGASPRRRRALGNPARRGAARERPREKISEHRNKRWICRTRQLYDGAPRHRKRGRKKEKEGGD